MAVLLLVANCFVAVVLVDLWELSHNGGEDEYQQGRRNSISGVTMAREEEIDKSQTQGIQPWTRTRERLKIVIEENGVVECLVPSISLQCWQEIFQPIEEYHCGISR